MKRALLLCCLAFPAGASEYSLTVLPRASVRYRGEGKILPESYVNRFSGHTAPLYRLDFRQTPSNKGTWALSLLHTGVFGGGEYALERVPDAAGGTYQTDQLNVGFTNVHVTRRRPLAAAPNVEWLLELTAARQIFKRKSFVVQGVEATGMDDVNEISAEGVGFGLGGRHGKRLYGRWEAAASHLVQIFDAKTDASAGQIFRAEAGLGWELGKGYAVEAGGSYLYWFILGQGNRRLHVPGTDGAVISWNRQDTRASGFFLTLRKKTF